MGRPTAKTSANQRIELIHEAKTPVGHIPQRELDAFYDIDLIDHQQRGLSYKIAPVHYLG